MSARDFHLMKARAADALADAMNWESQAVLEDPEKTTAEQEAEALRLYTVRDDWRDSARRHREKAVDAA
jgi:hypothetical protein